jgi:lantibiotic biosynthesis protein
VTAERARFLDAATRIGRRLCRDAIWWEGRCNWLGWAMEAHGGQWISVHRAMSALVYDGTAGIGVFLARLSRLSDDPIIRTTAEGALAQALTAIDPLSDAGEYGFYSGLSGIAWSCIDAGTALASDELIARGRAAMCRAARLAPKDQRLDIINGSAGFIPALLAVAKHDGRGQFVETAQRHGEHLLKLAARTDQGWSWDTLGMPNERHLLGLAHGASGIAYALAALGTVAARADLLAAAKEALRYERAHFRVAEGNWPDLRSFAQGGSSGEPPCMLAWCHGAPGIGLARLALHELMPDESAPLAEAETAIRTTSAALGQAASGTGNFSLCHGDGGNADLLVMGADVLDRPDLRQAAEAAGARALDRFEHAGMPWPCGVMNAGETPNLLLGLSGIGHFFLRLYDSGSIPTVLLPAATPIGTVKTQRKAKRRSSASR